MNTGVTPTAMQSSVGILCTGSVQCSLSNPGLRTAVPTPGGDYILAGFLGEDASVLQPGRLPERGGLCRPREWGASFGRSRGLFRREGITGASANKPDARPRATSRSPSHEMPPRASRADVCPSLNRPMATRKAGCAY